jgi:hypothetical protein
MSITDSTVQPFAWSREISALTCTIVKGKKLFTIHRNNVRMLFQIIHLRVDNLDKDLPTFVAEP